MFSFTEEQDRKFFKWLDIHNEVCPYVHHHGQGGNGGHLTFSFTPVHDGTVAHATVKCGCGGYTDLGRA